MTTSMPGVRLSLNSRSMCYAAIVLVCLGASACAEKEVRPTEPAPVDVLPKDALSRAVGIYKDAELLERQGYYEQVIDTLGSAISVFYDYGAGEWIARALLLAARSHSLVGQYSAAIDSINRVNSVSGVLENDSIRVSTNIDLANTLTRMGNAEEAITLLNRELTDRTATATLADEIAVRLRTVLGYAYYELDAYEKSINNFELALKLIDKRGFVPNRDMMLVKSRIANNLALAWFNSSRDFDRAVSYLTVASGIRSTYLPNDHPLRGEVYGNLGMLMAHAGFFHSALENLTAAEEVFEARTQQNGVQLAVCYSNKGMLLAAAGEHERALEYLSRSLDVRLNLLGSEHPRTYYSHIRLADLHSRLRNHHDAIRHSRKAIRIWRNHSGHSLAKIAIGFNQIAKGYFHIGKLDSSEFYALQSLESIDKSGTGLAYKPEALRILAKIYTERGQLSRARQHLLLAAQVARSSSEANRSLSIRILNDLAESYAADGNLNSAASVISDALTKNDLRYDSLLVGRQVEGPLSPFEYLRSLRLRVLVRDTQGAGGDPELVTVLSQVLETMKQVRGRVRTIASHAYLSANDRPLVEDLAKQGFANYSRGRDLAVLDKTVSLIESSKASIIRFGRLESLVSDSVGILKADYDHEQLLRERLQFVESEVVNGRELSSELFQARRDYDQFLLHLSRTYPGYYEFQHSSAALSATEIAASLREDEALVEFFETPDSVYVIGITKEARSVHTSGTDRIARTTTKYLDAIRDRAPKDYLESAYKLYHELLKPIESLITDKNLIVVPDGRLHFVPFESLLTSPSHSEDGSFVKYQRLPYLLKKHSIEYAYSASLRDFVRRREYPHWKSDFLGVAPGFKEVTFSWPQVRMDSVNYLPGTVNEVRSIYGMFVPWFDVLNRSWRTRSTALIGSRATEEQLRSQDLEQYRFLHFATHGSVTEENPAVSGLLLYPGSSRHDDVLRLGEIYGLRLSADLVVLSACDTGLGRLVDGEGVVGLTGGFLYAGARNVVVSLWQVEDRSAAELMRGFYANSLRSNDFRKSLRQAKLAVIEAGGEFSRPYHWAGYVLFGSSSAGQ